ncbi:MAG TPA: L,D-transpeptidase [Thermoanaerobaculia bacterium]
MKGPVLAFVAAAGALVAAGAAVSLIAAQGGWYEPLPAVAAAGEEADAGPLAARLAALGPRGAYVVADTHRNRLRVYRDGELLRDAVCSTGSGALLRDPETGRQWIFDTPLGEHRVRRKARDPVWFKPDWAFIEEGFQPPASFRDRVDDVSLGDYGLYLGDGYIIHGTLFQTLLGQPITHGCIRLGDDDLEYVYKNVPLGARVYLY